MKRFNFIISVSIVALSLFVFVSCTEEQLNEIADAVVTLTEDNDAVNAVTDEVDKEIDEVLNSIDKLKYAEQCPTRTKVRVGNNDTVRITVDFGTTGCVGKGNRSKTGKIQILGIKGPWEAGSTHTATFDNFKVNNNEVFGSKTVKYDGLVNDVPQWTVTGNYTVVLESGDSITRVVKHTRLWLEGYKIWTIGKKRYPVDSISINKMGVLGTSTGLTRQKKEYEEKITDTLIFSQNCRNVVSGAIEYKVDGQDLISIVYENMDCKGSMKISQGDKSKTVNFKR